MALPPRRHASWPPPGVPRLQWVSVDRAAWGPRAAPRRPRSAAWLRAARRGPVDVGRRRTVGRPLTRPHWVRAAEPGPELAALAARCGADLHFDQVAELREGTGNPTVGHDLIRAAVDGDRPPA